MFEFVEDKHNLFLLFYFYFCFHSKFEQYCHIDILFDYYFDNFALDKHMYILLDFYFYLIQLYILVEQALFHI